MHQMDDMQATKTIGKDRTRMFNRLLYSGFLLIAAYHVFFKGEFGDAAMHLCIALIFDPFNPEQPWPERPMYQRVWLIVHLCLAAALAILHFTR
jgi:hypothetical protein